ncbi:hypothetical protein LENED_008331 [Lentinula edodes]|uniref:Secreted protein n=1 Tax=Lentinula edodes TaxID=5353 RepID=A0A1Q3EGX5_LENED|nr:hypothetical protein LENED_008331 [Lentinula edodes]
MLVKQFRWFLTLRIRVIHSLVHATSQKNTGIQIHDVLFTQFIVSPHAPPCTQNPPWFTPEPYTDSY